MNGLNSLLDSHFLQEGAPRNLSEMKVMSGQHYLGHSARRNALTGWYPRVVEVL